MKFYIQKYSKLLGFIFLTAFQAHAGNVVIIGDSLSANGNIGLGSKVFDNLNGEHQVQVVGSCGSSPWWYRSDKRVVSTSCGYLRKESGKANETRRKSPTPKLKDLVNTNTDLTVIQQGTNLYGHIIGGKNGVGAIKTEVRLLLTELSQRSPNGKCLWVAPPEIARYDGRRVTGGEKETMFRAISSAIEEFEKEKGYKCKIYDSRIVTRPPGGDGTHFSSIRETQGWINGVTEAAKKILGSNKKFDPEPGSFKPGTYRH